MTAAVASCGEELFLNDTQAQIVQQRIALLLLALHKEGYTDFCVNASAGIPLWTARIVMRMKKRFPVRLHLVCPHEEQARRWTEGLRNEYYSVHAQADSVTFAAPPDDPESYHRADEAMLSRSTLLLFYDKQGYVQYALPQETPYILTLARLRGIEVQEI
ncbi:MAG: DUF1273 family protein [Oscillospiraceae bacterium]|nr:DUF1273 family protein [Oscillospiraceae bacterium]